MSSVLQFTKSGIYCAAGDFFIDPVGKVDRAVITHGHADHARPGMGRYLATHAALPILRHRLGKIDAQGAHYGETIRIGGATVSFHPAGHVPGSAQIRVEVGGEVWVASGDYKVEDDGLSEPFEPVPCHHFITESTFALPVFNWPPQADIARQINDWWAACAAAGKTAILGAYSLGKAQRLMGMLDASQGAIVTHGAVEATNKVLRAQGIALPPTIEATAEFDAKAHPGSIVIAPPSALSSAWAKQFGVQESGFASGWMALRGVRRRRAYDRGFVISDHADWTGLLGAIEETKAENIYVTHGYTDVFMRYLNLSGLQAHVVAEAGQAEGDTQGDDG